jgi:hypothetical protein
MAKIFVRLAPPPAPPFYSAIIPGYTEAEALALQAHLVALLSAGAEPGATVKEALRAEQARLRAQVARQYNLEDE